MMTPWIGDLKPSFNFIFRRALSLEFLLIAWIVISNSCTADSPQATIASDKHPNILFILVDDQSPWDLKTYNPNSKLDSPVLDRLANQGMVIDGAYHMGSFSGAVCTPSRHMIMSGRTLWHLPISPKVKQRELCPPNLEFQTIPAVFNRAGYITMRTCKQGNSYEKANEQFTIRKDATKRGGTAQTG
ncbi:MAG: sulfatase-like hydrolase/transferase, partial [Pirellula sp.]